MASAPTLSSTTPPPAPAKPARPTPASSLDIYQGDPNFMTSLARGLIVIQAFTQQSPQMTISQLSVKTGLSRAAVRRCLYTLTKLGFAGAEDGQRYALRPRMLSLSHTYTTSSTLSTAAQPILERMSGTLRESFSVATLDGDEIVYIARTQVPSRVMAVDLHIGSRLPAYCTSMGRVLLAFLPPDQIGAVSGAGGADAAYDADDHVCGKAAAGAAQRAPAGVRAGRPGAGGGAAVAGGAGVWAGRARDCDGESLRQCAADACVRYADEFSGAAAECGVGAECVSAVAG